MSQAWKYDHINLSACLSNFLLASTTPIYTTPYLSTLHWLST